MVAKSSVAATISSGADIFIFLLLSASSLIDISVNVHPLVEIFISAKATELRGYVNSKARIRALSRQHFSGCILPFHSLTSDKGHDSTLLLAIRTNLRAAQHFR
jgi:hypothetical protein